MFDNLSDRLGGVFKRIRGKGRLTEADVNEMLAEIRTALLEADVNMALLAMLLNAIASKQLAAKFLRRLTQANRSSKLLTPNWLQCLAAKP